MQGTGRCFICSYFTIWKFYLKIRITTFKLETYFDQATYFSPLVHKKKLIVEYQNATTVCKCFYQWSTCVRLWGYNITVLIVALFYIFSAIWEGWVTGDRGVIFPLLHGLAAVQSFCISFFFCSECIAYVCVFSAYQCIDYLIVCDIFYFFTLSS